MHISFGVSFSELNVTHWSGTKPIKHKIVTVVLNADLWRIDLNFLPNCLESCRILNCIAEFESRCLRTFFRINSNSIFQGHPFYQKTRQQSVKSALVWSREISRIIQWNSRNSRYSSFGYTTPYSVTGAMMTIFPGKGEFKMKGQKYLGCKMSGTVS